MATQREQIALTAPKTRREAWARRCAALDLARSVNKCTFAAMPGTRGASGARAAHAC
jgi:hypothetical protein